MILILAWIASALVATVVLTAFPLVINLVMSRGTLPRFNKGMLQFPMYSFAAALGIQIVYGTLLFAILRYVGQFKVVVLLVAYLLPAMIFIWMGSDVQKDLLAMIPVGLSVTALAIVFWLFLRAS
jgi:hypothetical protein